MSVLSLRAIALAATSLVAVFLLSLALAHHVETTRVAKTGDAFPSLQVDALDGSQGPLQVPESGTVLVNVFATWCGPCIQELPALKRESVALQKRGVRTLGIDQGESIATLSAFRASEDIPFPVVADPQSITRGRLGARIIPETLVVRNGVVAAIYSGPLSTADLDRIASIQ